MKSMVALGMIIGGWAIALASSLSAAAYTEKTLYTFCPERGCKDGANPQGVVVDQAGDLFGVTPGGGKWGEGTVFEFVPTTGQYSVLYSFCKQPECTDGAQPAVVNLVIDTQGNLYGTASRGGGDANGENGVVFELFRKDGKWGEKALYSFCSRKDCADGALPYYGLTYAGAASGQPYDGVSPLYGTTYAGGGGTHEGTVFSLTPKAGTKKWSEQVLYAFCSQRKCTDGKTPFTPLYIDDQGNIYGTAAGGSNNQGVVFELSSNGSGYTETLPYTFCEQAKCADGAGPQGGVIMDTSGNLYGTTSAGGSGLGVVFKLSPNGSQWQYSNMADFDGSDGGVAFGPVIIDANGDLFGTTAQGAKQHGNVFEFNGAIQSLYNFCPGQKCRDGEAPEAGVVEDSAGNLFGVTSEGGHNNSGTLFELSP